MFMLPLLLVVAAQRPNVPNVDISRLKSSVETLVGFKSRNTNSPMLDQSAAWIESQFKKNPGLLVEVMKYPMPQGEGVPFAKEAVQVIATLPGTASDRRVIIGAHFDNLDVDTNPLTGFSPGADDNASGVAVVLECARIMSATTHKNTLMFVAFSGNEEGLLGSRALAHRARAEGWKVDAFLNNDSVGNSSNSYGQVNNHEVRVFSPGGQETQSRELARLVEWINRQRTAFKSKLVFRPDRILQTGDQTPFNAEGFPSIQFTEAVEEFSRQHNGEDQPQYIDYRYLANVTRANLRAAGSLANAAEPPENVRVQHERSQDTLVEWEGNGRSYTVYIRDTTSPVWQMVTPLGGTNRVVIRGRNKDDYVFAVGAAGGVPVVAKSP